jgi:hypothetical protein
MRCHESVRVATTVDEREAIYRARYDVYINEMGRTLSEVDYTGRMIHEPEDDDLATTLLFTVSGGDVTGTVRVRTWRPGCVPSSEWARFSMGVFPGLERCGVAELDRLLIRRNQRGGVILVALMSYAYESLAARAVDAAFAYCAPGLLRYYRSMGMRPYNAALVNLPDGVRIPLVMFIADYHHLAGLKSFLAPLAERHFGTGVKAPINLEPFIGVLEAGDTPVEVERDVVWARLQRGISRGADEGSSFLAALAPSTVKKLTDSSFLVHVPTGTLVTERGLAQREIFVIVEGVFEAVADSRRLRLMSAGDVFGEVAFFHPLGRRIASVRALSDGTVLVLRRRFLDELRESDPEAAADILVQLARVLALRLAEQP